MNNTLYPKLQTDPFLLYVYAVHAFEMIHIAAQEISDLNLKKKIIKSFRNQQTWSKYKQST